MNGSCYQLENDMGQRPCFRGTASEIAQEHNDLAQALSSQLPLPDNSVSTKDASVNEMQFRIYTPVEAVSNTALTVGGFA
jgi:hypothetical protein